MERKSKNSKKNQATKEGENKRKFKEKVEDREKMKKSRNALKNLEKFKS